MTPRLRPGSRRVLPRTLVVLAVLLAPAAAAASGEVQSSARPSQSQSSAAQPSGLRWYEAYDQGVAAVRKEDWERAEPLLLEARTRHPEQGPNVFFFGQTYKPFVPDYYLAQVYLNTGREVEALSTLRQVADRKLVEDARNLALLFDRARKAVLARAETARENGNVAEVERLIAAARDGGVGDAPLQGLQAYVDAAKDPPPPDGERPAPSGTLAGGRLGGAASGLALPGDVAYGRPTPDQTGATGGAVRAAPGQTVNMLGRRTPRESPQQGPVAPPTSAGGASDWEAGLRAFLAGDYPTAAGLLASAADPAAPPRMRLYLLSARVGQVLVGRADAATLASAREAFRSANLAAAIQPADGAYISPRILAQLRGR